MRAAVGGLARMAGFPLRGALLAMLALYRRLISPLVGTRCRFYPSCSEYAEGAVRTHGALKGSVLAAWRVLRCNPLSAGGIDRVPLRGGWRSAQEPGASDNVIRES